MDERPSALVRSIAGRNPAQPSPIHVVWELTLACDLGCRHCGSRAGKARPDELSTDECLEVVDQLVAMGVREVSLIGGEAYLRDDWTTVARALSSQGVFVSMTTGARNLDAARVQAAVDAGLGAISISLDGLEATHDALRGAKGAWRAAVDAARRVAATPIKLATNTQVNRLSLPELPAIAELLADIGSRSWQVQLTVPMGRAADRPELLLQPHDLLELFPLLVWIKREKLGPAGIRLFAGNNVGYFGPWEQALRYGGEAGSHWSGCSAGKWSIGLEADGRIKACPSLPTESYGGGTTRQRTIADAVANAPEVNQLRQRTRDDLWGFCKTCYYGDVCLAGCTWTSHVFLGKPGNNPYCIHRALELDRQGLRERLVKVGPAPGRPFDHGLFALHVEPAPPLDERPSIAGIDLARVTSLTLDDASAWDDAERGQRLAPG
ncbi:MAG: radical SAM protein [Myxococcota bacterium]